MDFFFPWLKDERQDPSRTLQAPFMPKNSPDQAAPTQPVQPNSLPNNAVPLHLPHRSTTQVAQWAGMAASDALSIESMDLTAHIAAMRTTFNPPAITGYQVFLNQSGIAQALSGGRYDLHSVLEDAPILLNEGAVNGVYHWLFEARVMLTYLPRGTRDYSSAKPVNQNVRIVFEIVRVDDSSNPAANPAPNPDGMMISSWALSRRK
jgi:hypothetical protein